MDTELTYNDLLLLRRISDGDEQAFTELYRRYDALLYPFLKKLTRSAQDAQEIIQETFLKVWLSRDRLDVVEHPRAYIFRIAVNLSHNWMKRHLIGQKAELEHLQTRVTDTVCNIESQLKVKDLQAVVNKIIEEMPEQRRRIYLLNRDEGVKTDDIAKQLDIAVSTVKNTLAVAVKTIRENLEKSGYLIPILLFLIKR